MKSRNRKEESKEIEQIRRMKELEGIIKKNDIENAFVVTTSKDSESVSSDIADNIINKLSGERINEKELTLIENMTTRNGSKHQAQGAPQGKQHMQVHMVKAGGKKAQAKPKAAKHVAAKHAKKKGIKKRNR